jgi:hypothetical protein
MGIYTDAVQKLYVAYFNRPADAAGLTYWEGVVANAKGSTAAVSAAFAASDEYKAAYAGKDAYNVIATIYQNLFGHAPDLAGLTFWGQGLLNKAFTVDTAVTEIAKGALGTDLVAYNNKVAAATAFTAALDTPAEVLGYTGNAANTAAKNWMAGITDNASLTAALANLDATVLAVTTPVPVSQSFTLTTGVDTVLGGTGNDTINATTSAGAISLTTFDNVDGGAGIDTMTFVDTTTGAAATFGTPAGTVKNVELVNINTTGGLSLNTKGWTGVTDVTVNAAGTAAAAITVADSTNVTLSSANTAGAGVAGVTVTGGKAVTLTGGTGDVSVTGAALTNVSIKGGSGVAVDNIDGSTTPSGKGATLTNVTLDGVTGGAASLKGASLTNVSLKNIAQAETVTVTNNTASHGLNISVDKAGSATATTPYAVTVADGIATSLTVHANGASNLAVNAIKATKVTIDGAAALTMDVAGTTNTKVTSIDASAATGAITLANIGTGTTSIMTGAGNDKFTVTTATMADDTATTDTDETVNATVSSGAGDDKITVAVTGTGKTTIDAGAGNDIVNITGRSGTLNISLGDGNDTFTSGVAINGTDTIDAGAGVDTLTLNLVGASNIGAFSGFDVFDAAALAKTLDVDILATKNTVSEFIASGDVGAAAALVNVGAGVGVRATGDMGATNALSITQKTAGALTVTVDADETGTATDAADARTASVNATNATSLKAVFDTSYLASTTAEKALTVDNTTTLNLTAGAAASLEIVSGGALSNNVLSYTDSANKLASVTVSGAQHLDLTVTSTKLATVDASAATGGLSMSTASLADGGKIILGSGVDTITVASTSVAPGATTAGVESIQGFEKTGAVAISTKAVDATAAGAAIADADTLVLTSAHVAADAGAIKNGVLTFTGAGPSTLDQAIGFADAAAATTGDAVVFEYLGNSYIFVQGAAAGTITGDVVVKLVGTTGVTNLAELSSGTPATLNDHFILV